MAFSSVALAMRLPRTWRKMRGHSPPCSGDSAASIGPSSCMITAQALSVDSSEKIRTLARRAFAPAGQPLGLNLGQQDSPVAGDAKAGLKGTHQRHVQFAQNNRIDSHKFSLPWEYVNEVSSSSSCKGPSSKTPFPSASREKPSTANPRENAC